MEQSIKKHVRKRTVYYWGIKTEQYFLLLLGITVMYTLLSYGQWDNIWLQASVYMMMVGCIMIFILPMTFAAASVPLLLSMGASRKETFWGMQFCELLFLAQMGIVAIFSSLAIAKETEGSVTASTIWMVEMIFILVLIAFSQYGAWLQLRYGTKGSVIYSILLGLLLIGTSFVIGFSIGTRNDADGLGHRLMDMFMNNTVLLCVMGIVLTIALGIMGVYLTRRELMRYEVRR